MKVKDISSEVYDELKLIKRDKIKKLLKQRIEELKKAEEIYFHLKSELEDLEAMDIDDIIFADYPY